MMKLKDTRAHACRAIALALCGLSTGAHAATDLNGYWLVEHYTERLTTASGKVPPLRPKALALFQKNAALKSKGNMSFDPVAKCVMPGMPRLMYLPYPIEFVQTPHRIAMLSAWNRVYRLVDMSGKAAQPADYPLILGESHGRWDGDALLITTRDLVGETWLDAHGLPHSEALTLTEKYTLSKDGRRLEGLITIDDPEAYTQPWQTKVSYRKLPDSFEFPEDSCLDRIEAGEPAVKQPSVAQVRP